MIRAGVGTGVRLGTGADTRSLGSVTSTGSGSSPRAIASEPLNAPLLTDRRCRGPLPGATMPSRGRRSSRVGRADGGWPAKTGRVVPAAGACRRRLIWNSRTAADLKEMEKHVTTSILALEPGFFRVIGGGLGAIVLYALVGLLLMLLGFYAIDLTTPGKLNQLVREGRPNAVAVTAFGMVSMAFIIVVAIYGSSGRLLEGLLASLIFGLVGIVVQAIAVRILEWVTGIDIGDVLAAEERRPQAFVVCAAHIALGLVVAVAIL